MINHKPKIIVFDIGGVLLNWKVAIPKIAQMLNVTNEIFFDELQKHLKNLELGKDHQNDFWEYLVEKYNSSLEPNFLKKTWIEEQIPIEPGWDLLRKTKKSGYRVVCCTNNWKDTVERQVKLHSDFSLFEFILNSADVGTRKPDERIYLLVEEKVGEKGQDIFFIDDSKENCEGAEKIGWQTFQFDCETDGGAKDAEEISNKLGLD